MKRIRTMIGMPVVLNDRRIGRVVQVELSDDLRRMEALWIGGGFRGTRRIPAESIAMLGEVAIVSDDAGVRKRLSASPLFRRAVGTDGRRLGAITGAEIDEISFSVSALELTQGFWDDLLTGRQRILHYTLNRENGNVITDLAGSEKEETGYEDGNDEGTHYGRADRRHGCNDVRNHELAGCKTHEPADEKDRPLAVHENE